MSELTITKADLTHVAFVVQTVQWILAEYPELFTELDEQEIAIVEQLLEDKLA